jgi:hypothetical protein
MSREDVSGRAKRRGSEELFRLRSRPKTPNGKRNAWAISAPAKLSTRRSNLESVPLIAESVAGATIGSLTVVRQTRGGQPRSQAFQPPAEYGSRRRHLHRNSIGGRALVGRRNSEREENQGTRAP